MPCEAVGTDDAMRVMSADGDDPTRSGATFDASALLSLKGLRRTASLELDSDVETDVGEVAAGAHKAAFDRCFPLMLMGPGTVVAAESVEDPEARDEMEMERRECRGIFAIREMYCCSCGL